MKYILIFICCVFFFLLGCTNEKDVQRIGNQAAVDNMYDSGSFFFDDGRRQIIMNVFEGTLYTLRILDYCINFGLAINFSDDSKIKSLTIGSPSSAYGMISFFFHSNDHLLYRREQIGDLLIIQEVFKDGRLEFSTSLVEDNR